MKLGIDFGTTRIVVAFVDRGNYPVVSFDVPDGSSCDWFPPLVAVKGNQRLYGWDAWAAQEDPAWTVVRSLKRVLEVAGPQTRVEIGSETFALEQLLNELLGALRDHLVKRSSLPATGSERLEVMLGVPANANTNQRYLTAEAFRQSGFEALGLLNEPSAASIEFGHRSRSAAKNAATRATTDRILVYDLGGGTFDASLVELDGAEHRIIASEGISTLGGDDFDDALAELALERADVGDDRHDLGPAELFRLHEECREKKEALNPNTRRITIDLDRVRSGWGEVSIPVLDFYEHCRPLVEETLHAVEDLLGAHGYAPTVAANPAEDSGPRLEALYVTGGASQLPLVSRVLREHFGRRVRRSAYTRSATAIGLAIQADAQAGYRLRDQFTRYFGVWREAEGGREISFDPLFPKGAMLPGPDDSPLRISRRYFPAHNIGRFRYLECAQLTEDGRPTGDITLWDEISFPFDPSLVNQKELSGSPVEHFERGASQEVEESYACDASGAVSVTIANLAAGYQRQYRLGRWAEKTVVPSRRQRPSARRKHDKSR